MPIPSMPMGIPCTYTHTPSATTYDAPIGTNMYQCPAKQLTYVHAFMTLADLLGYAQIFTH
jgi:hypothetical protein